MPAASLVAALWALVAAVPSCTAPASIDQDYVADIERYRADRVERLQRADGWLTLLGLFWLEPGETTFGSAPSNPILLPGSAVPPVAGRFLYDGTSVRLVAEPGLGATVDGQPIEELSFDHPPGGSAPVVTLGRLRILVIERGGRHAVRVKDAEHPAREQFSGLDYYPIRPEYRVRARLIPFDEPEPVEVATVIEANARYFVPGKLEFELDGLPLSLDPLISEPSETELFIIFKDGTSGGETYPAGRYLYATLEGEEAVLDFNKAYNPPCAFTSFATCPLPPPQNRLDLPIRAGERRYGK